MNQINAVEFDSVGFLNYREQISTRIRDFKFDFGLGFHQPIKDYNLSIGMVFSPSVDMSGKTNIFSKYSELIIFSTFANSTPALKHACTTFLLFNS